MISSRVLRLVVVLGSLLGPSVAAAATLRVESSGVDGPTCGLVVPCRTIAVAVVNAAAGDAIVVGPGQDVSAGTIMVNKALRITSRLGASATRIGTSVFITAGDVTFGRLNTGFTITGQMLVDSSLDGGGSQELVNVRIGGNVFVLPADVTAAGLLTSNTRGRIEHNRMVTPAGACSIGMFILSSADLISRNSVMGCSVGFDLRNTRGARVTRNMAVGNATSSVVGSGVGFSLAGNVAEFSRNVAVGNATGVTVDTTVPIPAFSGNAFAGNTSNCGVRNFSGASLNAAGNWWGSPTGPGPDPADAACDSAGSTTVTTPFATSDPSQGLSALR